MPLAGPGSAAPSDSLLLVATLLPEKKQKDIFAGKKILEEVRNTQRKHGNKNDSFAHSLREYTERNSTDFR